MRALGAVAVLMLAACGGASPPTIEAGFDTPRSGSTFLQPETLALQQDDFANPGFLWVDRGEALFNEARSDSPACAACHDAQSRPLDGVAARYPAIDAQTGELFNLERRINACRTRHQDRNPLAHDSDALLALSAYVTSLSRGAAINVDISGPARTYFEAGKAYFFARRGQFNLSCSHCHDDNWGKQLRGDTISQGHPNGFPAYRLEWQTLGSLHRRLHDCDAGVRAEPMAAGSEAYVALELYLAARAGGLAVETPGVRR